jgi:hypothetical protein
MRFVQCFDCNKVMWRLPLPAPRDNIAQHSCVRGKNVTRTFGKKVRTCRKKHKKDEQNPNGACLVTITKEKYLSQTNDGRYVLKSKSQLKKLVVKRRVTTKKARKARRTVKRIPRWQITARRAIPKSVPRAKKVVRKNKQKLSSKKRATKMVAKVGRSSKAAKTEAETLAQKKNTVETSSKNNYSKESAEGKPASLAFGSPLNPISLDSDEEKSQMKDRVPVDDIRIGEYGCARTHFDYPSVRFFEEVITLYVWDKKYSDEYEKESFEVDIPYSSLTHARFSKKKKLCYCVFETSRGLSERWSSSAHHRSGNLEGKFIHDSKNIRQRSIVIASEREDRILFLRKQFINFCPA